MNTELKDKLANNLKVDVETSCWNWQMTVTNLGYARVSVSGNMLYGHRLMYELAHGSIPKGMMVMHTCDNRCCMNPEHLTLGTHLDNLRDMVDKGRSNKGKKLPRLGMETAREIRRKYDPYVYKMMDLAEEYGVTYDCIAKILSNRTYREPQG